MSRPDFASAEIEVGFLDPERRDDVDDVSALHEEFLSDSVVVKFGGAFLREFYYRTLVEDGLIQSTICRANGRVVGFFSYTANMNFMGEGLKRHPLRVMWLVARSILRHPSLAREIILVLRLQIAGGPETREALAGCGSEGLSFAIRPEWARAVPPGGKSRMPMRLFEDLVADLKRRGTPTLCMYVQPDNLPSNLFFGSLGCDLDKVKRAGVLCNRYMYALRDIPAAPR